jgi:uncharacterized membrane protein YphA (DoxX/SURF4 family)
MGGRRQAGGNIAMIATERALRTAFFIAVRWLLAGVFFYAGVVKVGQVESFAASIARFQVVPGLLINPIALGLPPFEILCGLALLAGPWKRQAAFSILVLSGGFLIALLSAALRGIHLLWLIIARAVVAIHCS